MQNGLLIAFLSHWLIMASYAQESSVTPLDPAKAAEQQKARRQALEQDKTAIEQMREELLAQSNDISKRLTSLKADEVDEAMVEQARLDTKAVRLRKEDLQVEITNTERRIKELEKAISDLEAQQQLLQNPARSEEDSAKRTQKLDQVKQALAQQQTNLTLEKHYLDNLRNRLKLVDTRLSLLEQWQTHVEELYRQQQERSRQAAQEELRSRLQKQRQTYLDRIAQLNQRLEKDRDSLSEAQQRRLKTEIITTEERDSLVKVTIRLADIKNDLARLDALADNQEADPQELWEGLRQLDNLQLELENTQRLLQKKIQLFQQQQEVIERRDRLTTMNRGINAEEKRLINNLLNDLQSLNEQIQQTLDTTDVIQTRLSTRYKERLSQDLLVRKKFPTTIHDWNQLMEGIVDVPRILLYQVKLSLETAFKSMANASIARWMGLVFSELVLIALIALLWQGLKWLIQTLKAKEEIRFSGKMAIFFADLLYNNLLGIGFSAFLLIAIWISQVPQPGQGIIITLVLLWVGIKIPINMVELVLASPHLPEEQRRPELYGLWFKTLLVGGILAAMTILVHLSGVSETVGDVFDRVLMLYLLVVLAPVLRARRFVIGILARHYAGQYWFIGLRLISFLLPLSLSAVAVMGLVGYLNLAWMVAWYLVVSILVLTAWLMVQGLLNDFVALLKECAARHSGEALSLWPQEIIDPSYKVISILLFLGACILLFKLYGWDEDSTITTAWQILALAVLMVITAYEVVYFIAANVARRTQSVVGTSLVRHSRKPLGIILPLAVTLFTLPTLPLTDETLDPVRHLLILAQIGALSWLVISLVSVLDDIAVNRYLSEVHDKLGARRVRTQMRMLRQIIIVAVYLVAISAMLMTFPKVRQLGAGLMASAGVAGLVIGIAARPFLANLIAGVQIGLTQPIRLDDEVIVEKEWGRIAEINPTHVIIQIWDDRRLVVPLNYFNEKPFENWTRTSTNLLGSVFIHVDYTFPVEALRQELKRILEENDLWDRRAWVLQVTDAKEQTLELRALMSAPDAPTAWDLRCQVREKLIEFIQKHYPQCLPKTRAVLEGESRG